MADESMHARSNELVERLARTMDGLELAATDRNRLAAGCFRQAMEHHEAVIHLVREKRDGPALALVRPLFEHYVRGLWLAKCASAAELQLFQSGMLERRFGAMVAAVEFLEAGDAGVLAEMRTRLSPALRGFLRGGRSVDSPGDAGDPVARAPAGDEVRAAIALAGAIGLLAASEVALMAGRRDIVSALADQAVSLRSAAQG